MAAATTMVFVVSGLNSLGSGRVNVSFIQETVGQGQGQGAPVSANGSLNLNLTEAEAKQYFPGQRYTVALTAA